MHSSRQLDEQKQMEGVRARDDNTLESFISMSFSDTEHADSGNRGGFVHRDLNCKNERETARLIR